MPRTGGGATTTTSASWIATSFREQRALDRRRRLVGILGALSRTASSTRKIAPAFGALVKVAPEKPTMLTAPTHARRLQRDIDHLRLTASVRASDAPGGNCTTTIR